MPKKQQKQSAAEQSKKGAAGKGARKPSVGHSRREKDARARGNKPPRSARGAGPVCEKCGEVHKRCSAHNRFGKQCMQMPMRFQQTCRSHGASTKLSKRAAQERMMELVWPAIARLDKLVRDPNTPDEIVVKVVAQILDRAHAAGLNRNARMEVSLETTPWDELLEGRTLTVVRGVENVIPDGATPEALPGPGPDDGGGLDDETLDALLAARAKVRAQEAATQLDNSGHDVVTGRVMNNGPGPGDYDPLHVEERANAASRRPGEYTGGPGPEDSPWADYERRIAEGVEDR